MSWFTGWRERRERRKRYEWLIEEFPKLAVAQFETLRDLNHPDTPKERLYKIIINSFAYTIGIPYVECDESAEDILQRAKHVNSLSLRTVVTILICETAGLKTQFGVKAAMACVWDIIPEHY